MDARTMQMEFERRVQLIDPSFVIDDKLSSDTIFQFLNAYTRRFVKLIYLQGDTVQDSNRAKKNNIDSIKSLITRNILSKKELIENTDVYTKSYLLPNDYFLYIRSNSLVSETYLGKTKHLEPISNEVISSDYASQVLTTPYNNIILRHPQVVMQSINDSTCLSVIHDRFTKIEDVDLVYYRLPKQFNVLNVDNKEILDHCELPESVHMEIVEGAVEMFITENKYRLMTKSNDKQ